MKNKEMIKILNEMLDNPDKFGDEYKTLILKKYNSYIDRKYKRKLSIK